MPYELSFTKEVAIKDSEIYINECCWGGDVVRDQLLPLISADFEDVQTAQEDWGWFIWFRKGPLRHAIDIFCDDPTSGKFRVHLSSRRKKFLFIESFVGSPELEHVRDIVCRQIEAWAGHFEIREIHL